MCMQLHCRRRMDNGQSGEFTLAEMQRETRANGKDLEGAALRKGLA